MTHACYNIHFIVPRRKFPNDFCSVRVPGLELGILLFVLFDEDEVNER